MRNINGIPDLKDAESVRQRLFNYCEMDRKKKRLK
jgi:hypothetical protein